jgi:hypothetical protein
MSVPAWLQRLVAKHSGDEVPTRDTMFPEPTPEAVGRIRKEDAELADARRRKWLDEFTSGPPLTFERDLAGVNPAFLDWLAQQDAACCSDIAAYWETDCRAAAGINHQHERGQYARMTMVIAYAKEVWGYDA